MRAGRLRYRVVIQQQSSTQDSLGQPVNTWTDVDTVWASVEPLSGREFFAAQQVNAETTTRFRMRYRSDVTSKMRLSFRDRKYNILSVINSGERDNETVLLTGEGVNDG